MNEAPKKIYWSPDERLADENNDNSNEIPYIRADLVRDDIPDGSFVYLNPTRPFIRMTREEIGKLADSVLSLDWTDEFELYHFARDIEDALVEKNK